MLREYYTDDIVRSSFYSFFASFWALLLHVALCHQILLKAYSQNHWTNHFSILNLQLNTRHRRLVASLLISKKLFLFQCWSSFALPIACFTDIISHHSILNDHWSVVKYSNTSQNYRSFFYISSEWWNSLLNDIIHSLDCDLSKKKYVNVFT